ncbi:MAG TPA: hypothetical protein PLL75_04605 [Candidatus Omnitrophota bacterium]|nr:hypothetical protein [Candidatus Omnitrophota bacterium]HPS36992.1 hypothetical protein [Candidatus Omnitrophota bacterium]
MRKMPFFTGVLFLMSACSGIAHAATLKKTIAVSDFENKTNAAGVKL